MSILAGMGSDEHAVRKKAKGAGKKAGGKRRRAGGWRLFAAEGAYADSIVRSSLGDSRGCIESLEYSLEVCPTYAPTILSLGSVEYQRRRRARGLSLFLSLLDLPDDTQDLCEIIDEAGDFLIHIQAYSDGLELSRRAVARFPDVAVFHQGLGCCAGHEGFLDEAIAASRRALEIGPENERFVNDLGWSLLQAGRLEEARSVLERAVAMDPTYQLAAENLRLCLSKLKTIGSAKRARPARPAERPP